MSDTPNWKEKTILVVEDEEMTRFFFKTALQMTQVNLLFAKNGMEGVTMAQQNRNIDCVLMDIRLPGIDGYEATRQIKANRKDLPVIAQTAYALSGDRNKAFESGCDEFITKPIRILNLFEILTKYLR